MVDMVPSVALHPVRKFILFLLAGEDDAHPSTARHSILSFLNSIIRKSCRSALSVALHPVRKFILERVAHVLPNVLLHSIPKCII